LRQLAGRATWNVADQVVSSGTNLLLSVLVARSLSADGFGAFAVAFTVYSFMIGASRAMIAQPLVVRYTSRSAEAFHMASRSAAGAATLLGAICGAVVAAAGVVIGGALGVCLLAIGLLLPGLLLQDMWRAVFVAAGRPAAAFVNDVIWGVVQLSALGVLLSLDQRSAWVLVVGWGGAACVAAVIGGLQFGGQPLLRASVGWVKRQRDLLGYYGAGFLSVLGANNLTMFLIAGLGDPADVGALRAAQVVLGPLNLIGYSLSAFALPEISRRQLGGRAAVKVAVALSGLMVLADLAWGLAFVVLPDSFGTALLGDSWSNAQGVLPATLVGVVAIGLGFGASTLMIARGFAKDMFWVSSLLAPGFLVFGVLGLEWGGAAGAALGLSLAQVVVVPVVWWRVLVLMRRQSRSGQIGQPAGEPSTPTR
jgi:O-antigen/teichoic acid export membrane protein